MAGKKREDVREEDVTGLKYFDKLAPLLARLHDVGCQRDKAGNRTLHFDQYCLLMLLFLFNPVVRSLRAIQQASQLRKVQRKLGCLRASLGSLSEATDVFQPERLQEIIAELGRQLQPLARDPRLKDVRAHADAGRRHAPQRTARVGPSRHGGPARAKLEAKVRLHTQFDLAHGVPVRIDVTEGVSRGEADERSVLARALEKGRCYVEDRGYAKFKLFNAIVAEGSSYVCRLRDNSVYQAVQQRDLTPDDVQANVVFDGTVLLGETTKKAEERPDHPLRLVVIRTTPHEKRTTAAGPPSNGMLLLATNLLDLPAWLIGLIYRYRWTIEVFFRFFKHVLGCRHLLSHDPVGIQIQTYCAIIACMLISLWTGASRRCEPTR